MSPHESASPPQLEFALELRVEVGATVELGASACGLRRTVPITGGVFSGPQISGRVLPGGADWQFVEADGLTFLDAHYALETSDGIRIEVRNQGVRDAFPDVLARIAAGESVPSVEYYFRTTPRFFPPVGQCEWFRRSVFVATGERRRERVVVRVWRVV